MSLDVVRKEMNDLEYKATKYGVEGRTVESDAFLHAAYERSVEMYTATCIELGLDVVDTGIMKWRDRYFRYTRIAIQDLIEEFKEYGPPTAA